MRSEKEKMAGCELYDPQDPELSAKICADDRAKAVGKEIDGGGVLGLS